jgi:CheY-like chemotaxis protein
LGRYDQDIPLRKKATDVKVLIADDEQITRVTLKKLLTKRGYDVTVARDGTEAYELLCRPDAPSIAVLDWMMPWHRWD